ncbi:MAG: AbrB/MazE/SpoVT family DNA-binding domain-containing protein [Candidatus Odinarchaeota archaeon]
MVVRRGESDDKTDSLVMTLEPPQNGVFDRIKISEKGQLVIPMNLRTSKGIKEGSNLIFSVTGDRIRVQKLVKTKQKKKSKQWFFFLNALKILLDLSTRIGRENDAIILTLNGQQEASGNAFMASVKELETSLVPGS